MVRKVHTCLQEDPIPVRRNCLGNRIGKREQGSTPRSFSSLPPRHPCSLIYLAHECGKLGAPQTSLSLGPFVASSREISILAYQPTNQPTNTSCNQPEPRICSNSKEVQVLLKSVNPRHVWVCGYMALTWRAPRFPSFRAFSRSKFLSSPNSFSKSAFAE